MRAKAKKRDATALASSGKGGNVYPPNECSVAEGEVKVDAPVRVLDHVVAYIIPIRAGRAVTALARAGILNAGHALLRFRRLPSSPHRCLGILRCSRSLGLWGDNRGL